MDKKIFKPGETSPEDKVDAFLINTRLMEKLVEATGYWQDSCLSADTLKTAFESWLQANSRTRNLSAQLFGQSMHWPNCKQRSVNLLE